MGWFKKGGEPEESLSKRHGPRREGEWDAGGGDALGDKELFSVIRDFFLAKERDLGKRWGAQW